MNIYTDLAVELHEILVDENKTTKEEYEVEGVKVTVKEKGVKTTVVEILNENGSKEMGKPIGKYITLEWKEEIDDLKTELERELSRMTQEIKGLNSALFIGLGNRSITPDSLGPRAIDHIVVNEKVKAVAPGVLGTTGIETAEIVKALAEKTKPDLVIAIDALASRSASRVNKTIQISNTGIAPGSGMANKRKEITEATIGVPVIAIGVPTVVDAATLANDTIDKMLKDLIQFSDGSDFYKMIEHLGKENRYPLIQELLDPYENMFVTPKEVDVVMKVLSEIIGEAINEVMKISD